MTTDRFLSIACAILVWIIGVSFYLLSYYIPVLDDPERQANIVLAAGIIPSVCLGSYLFYKRGQMKASTLAVTFVLSAIFLDAMVTVPVFVIPSGGSYSAFFSDPIFYVIAVELFLVTYYFSRFLNQNFK